MPLSKKRWPGLVVALALGLLGETFGAGSGNPYLSAWSDWVTPPTNVPPGGLRWDLSLPDYDPPGTPAWARTPVPDWVKPFQGKNGMPHWEARYQKPGSTCNGAVAGLDRYQANQFIVSYYFVVRDEAGNLLSAADSHDRGPGQRGWARSRQQRMLEIAGQSSEELNIPPERLEKVRAWARQAGSKPWQGMTKSSSA